MNTSTLTISPVQQEDGDEYYCVASNRRADGLQYSDISHRAMVTVYGKKIILYVLIYHNSGLAIVSNETNTTIQIFTPLCNLPTLDISCSV